MGLILSKPWNSLQLLYFMTARITFTSNIELILTDIHSANECIIHCITRKWKIFKHILHSWKYNRYWLEVPVDLILLCAPQVLHCFNEILSYSCWFDISLSFALNLARAFLHLIPRLRVLTQILFSLIFWPNAVQEMFLEQNCLHGEIKLWETGSLHVPHIFVNLKNKEACESRKSVDKTRTQQKRNYM